MIFSQVTLPALNVADSVAFYHRLGFSQIVDSPHYARFACPDGGATFSVHVADTVSADSGVTVYFECEHLDQLCSELAKKGIEFLGQPTDQNRLNPPWRVIPDPS